MKAKILESTRDDGKKVVGYWKRVKEGVDAGDWVCVNVRNITYERGLEICNHEMGHQLFKYECLDDMEKCMDVILSSPGYNGHELFAEACEKNITRCLEVAK